MFRRPDCRKYRYASLNAKQNLDSVEFFNQVNFANPGGSVTAGSYGTIRSTTGNPRVIQFALKLTC